VSNWISVEDRLPDENHEVILVSLKATVDNASSGPLVVDTDAFYIDEGRFRFWGDANEYCVTHWQPLPEHAE
jgi:hypothetical protein